MKKEQLDHLTDPDELNELGPYEHIETIRISKLSYFTKAKNLVRKLFGETAELDKLIYGHAESGYLALSYDRGINDHRFEIYRLKGRELEEPEFIKDIRDLQNLDKRRGRATRLLEDAYNKYGYYIPIVRHRQLSKKLEEFDLLNNATDSAFANDPGEEKYVQHHNNMRKILEGVGNRNWAEFIPDTGSVIAVIGISQGNYILAPLLLLQILYSRFYFKKQMDSLEKESKFLRRRTSLDHSKSITP